MFDIGPEEMWTPFLEEVNDLMLEEKAARHENDHNKIAQICTRIVSARFKTWLRNAHLASCASRGTTRRSADCGSSS